MFFDPNILGTKKCFGPKIFLKHLNQGLKLEFDTEDQVLFFFHFVQLGLDLKLNTKIGLNHHPQLTHHKLLDQFCT